MPTNFTAQQRLDLLAILKVGAQNAITAEDIANQLNLNDGGTQVPTRSLITECIDIDYDLILSNSNGFYLADINNRQDFEHRIDSLESRAREILKKRNKLIRRWNKKVLANPCRKRSKYVH